MLAEVLAKPLLSVDFVKTFCTKDKLFRGWLLFYCLCLLYFNNAFAAFVMVTLLGNFVKEVLPVACLDLRKKSTMKSTFLKSLSSSFCKKDQSIKDRQRTARHTFTHCHTQFQPFFQYFTL